MFEKNWQELIKPTKIDIERETCSVYYVRFSAEPFERGYGITVGNSRGGCFFRPLWVRPSHP
jgi:DNA-directed RNA polymerase subunit alpha